MAEMTRDEEIKAIRKDYPLAYPLMLGLLAVIVLLIAGIAIYASHDAWGYGINVFTSVVSTVATVLILDRMAERRADRKAEEALKRQLVDDAASLSNEVAKNAVYQLRRKGWLKGESGLLKGENFRVANLEAADLRRANLQGTELSFANLEEANLIGVDLQNAKLEGTNFQRANLNEANLQRTEMRGTNLQGAKLIGANLQDAKLTVSNLKGANMRYANLQGARFVGILRDDSTVLPDGNFWLTETDIKRFTDPNHFNFWQLDEPASPAYRRKSEE